MPMKVPPEQILAAFNNLPTNATDEDLLNFTTSYFYPSGNPPRSYRSHHSFL